MRGYILWGVNNIYSVKTQNGNIYQSRIKGKVLKVEDKNHNALVPGDSVALCDIDDIHREALIEKVFPRINSLWRNNLKTNKKQTIASNVDQVIIVVSGQNPSFRPGFLDRALVVAMSENIPLIIVMNKRDQGLKEEDLDLWNFYREHFPTILTSATTGYGMENLKKALEGKLSVIFGQSGVGKSTIINYFFPQANQQTQSISHKYNRGRHTTVYGIMFEREDLRIIDTPGIKEFDITGVSQDNIIHSFPEIHPFLGKCQFSNCSHSHEPNCAIQMAYEEGFFLEQRFESFQSLRNSVLD